MNTSEFHAIYDKADTKGSFYLFLENVFHLYPEAKYHQLIADATARFQDDESIYKYIVAKLPGIKPFLSEVTYALPALKKQKKEMARQTLDVIGDRKVINGLVEIGSTGRYVSQFRKEVKVKEPIYLINDAAATNSLNDIFERGSLFKIGKFVPLNHYAPIPERVIASNSVDMVTCFIGLHHCPPDLLDGFVQSIYRILRKEGIFVLRDHDVQSKEMHTFVSLVHTVFNSGTNISWDFEHTDYKRFISAEEWSKYLTGFGFTDTRKRILQVKDPSLNTLMGFVK